MGLISVRVRNRRGVGVLCGGRVGCGDSDVDVMRTGCCVGVSVSGDINVAEAANDGVAVGVSVSGGRNISVGIGDGVGMGVVVGVSVSGGSNVAEAANDGVRRLYTSLVMRGASNYSILYSFRIVLA